MELRDKKSVWGTKTRLPGRDTVGGRENEAKWTAVEWAGPKFHYMEQKQCCSFKADMTTQSVNPQYRELTPQPGCLDPYLTAENQVSDLGVRECKCFQNQKLHGNYGNWG